MRAFIDHEQPKLINTDKARVYGPAIIELKDEGRCPAGLTHRQVQYLNNGLEAENGKLKRLIKLTLGFQSMKTAYATIKGFELMRIFKKGQMKVWTYGLGLKGEINLINRRFGIISC